MQPAWIWDDSGAHPRNHWVIFRKRLVLDSRPLEARWEITADSRYVAWVNGHRIGSGPVRGWPDEPFFDTYDLTSRLVAGPNALCVLVTHLGFSSFQYIESNAALSAEARITNDMGDMVVLSDGTWRTRVHSGYLPDSIRNYPQQGFTEVYDARRMDDAWQDPDYDDSGWDRARVLPPTSPVWARTPRARDIAPLDEAPVYPARVLSTFLVRPTGTSVCLDLQPCLETESRDMNKRNLLAHLATVIGSPRDVVVNLVFPWWRMLSLHGSVRLGGVVYELEPGQKSLRLDIRRGETLLLMDLGGVTHSYSSYFRFEGAMELTFRAPLAPGHRFSVFGPYQKKTLLTIGEVADESLDTEDAVYRAVWTATKEEDLEPTAPGSGPCPRSATARTTYTTSRSTARCARLWTERRTRTRCSPPTSRTPCSRPPPWATASSPSTLAAS